MDCSPPGSSILGIFQAIVLGWVAIPSPGDRPDLGIESASPALAGIFFTTQPPRKPWKVCRQPYYEVCEVEVIRSVGVFVDMS